MIDKKYLFISFFFTFIIFYEIDASGSSSRFVSTAYKISNHCWNDIDFKKTEKILREASIKKKIPFHEYYKNQTLSKKQFSNQYYFKRKEKHYNRPIFVLFYSNGLKAVFKGKERNRTDSNYTGMDTSMTAYNISKILNVKMIPPSVKRIVEGKEGLVQLFVENIKERKDIYQTLTTNKKSNLYLLVFLLGNRGFHSGNILISKNCFLPVLIDNDDIGSIVFKEYGMIPWIRYPAKKYKKLDLDILPLEKKAITLKGNLFLKLLQKTFFDLSFYKIKNIIKWYTFDDSIRYFKYKNSYYFYGKSKFYTYFDPISKNIQDYSSETIKKLKFINENRLRKIVYGSVKKNRAYLNGFLYRKDQFLKAIQEYQQEERQKKRKKNSF